MLVLKRRKLFLSFSGKKRKECIFFFLNDLLLLLRRTHTYTKKNTIYQKVCSTSGLSQKLHNVIIIKGIL